VGFAIISLSLSLSLQARTHRDLSNPSPSHLCIFPGGWTPLPPVLG
jgi:hypothetical protein